MKRSSLNLVLALVATFLFAGTAGAEPTRDVCGPVDLIAVTDQIYEVCGSGGGTATLICYRDGHVAIHSIVCNN